MLINSQLVKDHFGQYYKIQTSGDTPAPAVLTHERFYSTTQACRFIQNITVPLNFWQRILHSNNAFKTINYKNFDIYKEIANLVINNKLKFYKIEDPSLAKKLQAQREFKHTDNNSYTIEPTTSLLTNDTKKIKSFSNEAEAADFINTLSPDQNKINKIAEELNILDKDDKVSVPTNSNDKILGFITRALVKGTAIISVKNSLSAPPKPNNLLDASTEAVSDKQATLGPVTDTKDKKNEDYTLVKLLPNSGDLKQYVNLKVNSNDKTHGRSVQLEAHLDKAISGVTIYFKLIRDKTNEFKLPTRMQSDGLADSMKHDENIISQTTNSSGVAIVTMKLGSYGGDNFKGIASLESECLDDSESNVKSSWITVWRKLWFQLTHHEDLTPPSMSTPIKEFKKVFIEFEAETAVTHKKVSNGSVIVGSHNASDYHALHKNKNSGQSVHIILCDQQIDGTPGKVVDVEAEFTQDSNFIHTTAGGTYIMFDPPLAGGSLLVSGMWENKKTGKSGTLISDTTKTTDKIGLCIYSNENYLDITLPKDATPTTADPVKVSILVKVASGPWGGDGGTTPHNLIVIDSNDTIHTMCVMHELGHLINLGPLSDRVNCPDGFEYTDHPNLYSSNGAHCFSGGTSSLDGAGNKIGSNGTCIMYHQLNTSCSLEFCEFCTPFVKGMKLKKFNDLKK